MKMQYFNTVITQKGSSNSEMYSCRDSERNRFFRELRGEFQGNDNQQLCINRNNHRQQERNLGCKNVSKSIIFYVKKNIFWPYVHS